MLNLVIERYPNSEASEAAMALQAVAEGEAVRRLPWY